LIAGRHLICDIAVMFGVVRPCKHRLGGAGYARWMAHLCGLCLTLRGAAVPFKPELHQTRTAARRFGWPWPKAGRPMG
jgi:hypothetical protein